MQKPVDGKSAKTIFREENIHIYIFPNSATAEDSTKHYLKI
jgi:hypothetical protein